MFAIKNDEIISHLNVRRYSISETLGIVDKQLITEIIITSFLAFRNYFLYEYIKYPNNRIIEILNEAMVYIKITLL